MSKYIIARIELPLEIFPDGKYETCQDHISIDFVKCNELPPKSDLTGIGIDFNKILQHCTFTSPINSVSLNDNNKSYHTVENHEDVNTSTMPTLTPETKEYIPKEMVLHKKKREHNNSTFKNKLHVNRRFSLKNNQSV